MSRWLEVWLTVPAFIVLTALAPAASGRARVAPRAKPGPKPVPVYVGRLRALVPRLMAENAVPAVGIGIVRRGRVEWSGGFGKLDDGAPVTGATVFQAASLGKPLFARALMSLVDRRLVHLDVPLLRYLRGTQDAGLDLERATPRMVLAHTSGIVMGQGDERYVLEFPPGSRWKYSGAGIVLLQHGVEHATGQGLDTIVHGAVLRRAGMTSTSYCWREAYEGRAAVGHGRGGAPLPPSMPRTPSAASSLCTTAADYARFVAATLAEARGAATAAVRRMFVPAVAVDAKLGLSWGLGWALEKQPGGTQCFFHWGVGSGFRAFVLGCPADGSGIVILTNGDNGLDIAQPIVSAVDRTRHPLFDFSLLHPSD